MKLITRLLLIALGALGLLAAFLCGRFAFLSVAAAEGFAETMKQLFSPSNLLVTLICIVSFIIGIKDFLRGIIKGKSLLVFITGVIYGVATVLFAVHANNRSLIQDNNVISIIIVLSVLTVLSILVGILSLIIKIKN